MSSSSVLCSGPLQAEAARMSFFGRAARVATLRDEREGVLAQPQAVRLQALGEQTRDAPRAVRQHAVLAVEDRLEDALADEEERA